MIVRSDDPAPLDVNIDVDVDVEHEFEPAPTTLRAESFAELREAIEKLAALTRQPDLGAERAAESGR